MIGPVIPRLICLVTQVDQGPGSNQGQTGVIYSKFEFQIPQKFIFYQLVKVRQENSFKVHFKYAIPI